MAHIISMFSNKGGVSKTTTTFNLGWKLAELGKKVILIDADSQCNLTGMILSFSNVTEIGEYYEKKGNPDIYSDVEGYVNGNKGIDGLQTIPVKGVDGLSIVPGSIRLGEIESQITLGLKASSGIPRLAQLPGLYPKLIRDLAADDEADFVFIDTSPSITGINQSLIMGSDYFIVPTCPDYYSGQAILSMSKFLPNWLEETNNFRNGNATDAVGRYKFPSKPPKFMGYVVQNYRPRNGGVSRAFRQWVETIGKNVISELVPSLQKCEMIKENSYNNYLLGMFSDFNSLIALSQEYAVPVYALNENHLKAQGKVLKNYKDSIENFDQEFESLADKVVNITSG